MKNIEAIAYIPYIPEYLMEPVQNGDYKLTRRRCEKYVSNRWMEKEALNLLVGSAYVAKAKEISQKIEESSRKGEVPAGLRLMEQNLSRQGFSIIRESLLKLNIL